MLVLLGVLALMMRYSSVPGARMVITFAVCSLILFYLITGIGITRKTFFITAVTFAPHGSRTLIYSKALAGFTFAFSFFTFYAHEFFWRYRELFGILNALLLTLVMFISLAMVDTRDPRSNRSIMFRSAIASAILIFYTVVPLKSRLEWQFDDQYYREILEYSITNPDDEDARKEVRNYERRKEGLPALDDDDQGVEETQ